MISHLTPAQRTSALTTTEVMPVQSQRSKDQDVVNVPDGATNACSVSLRFSGEHAALRSRQNCEVLGCS